MLSGLRWVWPQSSAGKLRLGPSCNGTGCGPALTNVQGPYTFVNTDTRPACTKGAAVVEQPPDQVSREVRQAVETVRRAVEALRAEADPAIRGKEASDLLQAWSDQQPGLRELRREAVIAMRGQKVSYRKIAQTLGVSVARVQQIESGETTHSRTKKKADAPPAE